MPNHPKPIGQLFVELGLITSEDVDRALLHQKQRGGYFGEALVELGLLTAEQVKWGLADQHQLPFVHLHADGIDHPTATLVPADWARKHLMLPVLRTGDSVTVVMADPASLERIPEVLAFTGATSADPALSTPDTIRELIDAVSAGPESAIAPADWLHEALRGGATELGVSVRGGMAAGWYRTTDVFRHPLGAGWREALRDAVTPFAVEGSGAREWPVLLGGREGTWTATCRLLAGAEEIEWMAELGRPLPAGLLHASVEPLAHAEVTAAVDRGPVAVAVDGDDDWVALALPLLPRALRMGDVSLVHLVDRPAPTAPGVLALRPGAPLAQFVAGLASFRLGALTLDVERLTAAELQAARGVADLVAFRVRSGAHAHADLSLSLQIAGDEATWTR